MLLGSGTGEGGVLWSLVLPIFIAVIMLVLTVRVVPALGTHPTIPSDVRGARMAARVSSIQKAPSQTPSVAPSVA